MNNIIYISLIIIIVYSTALVILFGFIIMKIPTGKYLPYTHIMNLKSLIIIYIFTIIILYIYNYENNNIYYEYNIKNIEIISRIGEVIYKDPEYIIQVILSIIILLFPIIALIYI